MNTYFVQYCEPKTHMYLSASHTYLIEGDARAFEEYDLHCRMARVAPGSTVILSNATAPFERLSVYQP